MKWLRRNWKQVLLALMTVLMLSLVVTDFTTEIWFRVVLSAGVVAGLMTLAITVLVIDNVLSIRRRNRWEPVRRMAMSDLLSLCARVDNELRNSHPEILFDSVLEMGRLGEWGYSLAHPTWDDIQGRVAHSRQLVALTRTQVITTTKSWLPLLVDLDSPEPLIYLSELAESMDQLEQCFDNLMIEVDTYIGASGANEADHSHYPSQVERARVALSDVTIATERLREVSS